jgi:hypothetical protein
MKPINQLLPSQQDELRNNIHEYVVQTDWRTNQKFVLYENTKVDYNSIVTTQFLKG